MTDQERKTVSQSFDMLTKKVLELEQQVQKLDRLVYKLFKRLPRPVQKTAPLDQ